MNDIFKSDEYKQHLVDLTNRSYDVQNKSRDLMRVSNKCTICHPTGIGKSYIAYGNMLESFENKNVFAIASHRLMLNSQHLNNMIKEYLFLTGYIGYIYVGSDPYILEWSKKEKKQKKQFNNLLRVQGLNENDIIKTTTTIKEINDAVEIHLKNNRKVVIISTYHSLDRLSGIYIDTIYFDEAHLLATSELETAFKNNFKKIKFEKSYFFTATPKDSFDEDTDAFLMNNKEIFGERFGLTYREAIDLGLIVKPMIHIAIPSNYDITKDFGSVLNKCRFIKETFAAHRIFVKERSVSPELIGLKLLIKCQSVDDMWSIYNSLIKDSGLSSVKIFAGASRNDGMGENHKFNGTDIPNRQDFLKKITKLKSNEEAIILHFDIFSEGIDVPGLTGTNFLGDNLPTKPKILQNIGRSTRLHKIDRKLQKENKISTLNYSEWIKPNCAVILPIMDANSDYAVHQISEMIKGLRDRYGFDADFYVSEGCDIAKSKTDDEMPDLNKKSKKSKINEIITYIRQDIEKMDNDDDLIKFGLKVEKCQNDDELYALFEKECGL